MSMEYPRVNLLHKNEQRYQGVVSYRFLLISLVATPILLLLLLGGVYVVQRNWVESSLKTSRQIWTDLQPRLGIIKEENHGLQINQQALALVDGWNETQLTPVELLSEIQNLVPENIQFIKLSIHNTSKKSRFENEDDLKPSFSLEIEGLAMGEHAENAVIQLRKDMLSSASLSGVFESINLSSLRKRKSGAGRVMREFRLVGASAEGGAE